MLILLNIANFKPIKLSPATTSPYKPAQSPPIFHLAHYSGIYVQRDLLGATINFANSICKANSLNSLFRLSSQKPASFVTAGGKESCSARVFSASGRVEKVQPTILPIAAAGAEIARGR